MSDSVAIEISTRAVPKTSVLGTRLVRIVTQLNELRLAFFGNFCRDRHTCASQTTAPPPEKLNVLLRKPREGVTSPRCTMPIGRSRRMKGYCWPLIVFVCSLAHADSVCKVSFAVVWKDSLNNVKQGLREQDRPCCRMSTSGGDRTLRHNCR